MIELVFVVCLSASPQNCEERSLLYSDMSPAACSMRAQPVLADWINSHPRWTIAGWKCQALRKDRSA
ncbi:hypothetical protein ACFQXB_04085 [Plastorhodobacter daqingensis]|uniref:Secreted protein n=1 Tax=Plastorhodobacter daqingensis TaxID=1387281 RepID=A0ABW2UJH5_9RHOB